jgi:uncharacterized membrane protein YdfJ with MMPL/SSD domain
MHSYIGGCMCIGVHISSYADETHNVSRDVFVLNLPVCLSLIVSYDYCLFVVLGTTSHRLKLNEYALIENKRR